MSPIKPRIQNLTSVAATLTLAALTACSSAWAQSPPLPLIVGAAPEYAPAPVGPNPVTPAPGPETPADPAADQFTAAELRDLASPIALYPDPLLAQVLAGATYPLDIVQASRFLKANVNDPALGEKLDAQPWDPSVQALARYPSVLSMMDENLEWTQNLGAAFLYQQTDLMAAIQELRAQAQAAGNLATSKEQVVVVEERIIQIVPADPEVIYVPVYEPQVVYVERRPAYFGPMISFGIGFSVGHWLDLDCDWRHRHVYHGGWYHKHHGHSHPRKVHVHNHKVVHNGAHGYRYETDKDRHDDRSHRDHDGRDRSPVWRHNDSKPSPQRHGASQAGRLIPNSRVGTSLDQPLPRSSDRREDFGDRARLGDRSNDRSDRDARDDRDARSDRDDRNSRAENSDRPQPPRHTFRPAPGVVRSAPGVSRNEPGVARNLPSPVITPDTSRRPPIERVQPAPTNGDSRNDRSSDSDRDRSPQRVEPRINDSIRRTEGGRAEIPRIQTPSVQAPRVDPPRIVGGGAASRPEVSRSREASRREVSPNVQMPSIERSSRTQVTTTPRSTPPSRVPTAAPQQQRIEQRVTPTPPKASRPTVQPSSPPKSVKASESRSSKASSSSSRSESSKNSSSGDSSRRGGGGGGGSGRRGN